MHRVICPEPHIHLSETSQPGGWREIGVYVERMTPTSPHVLITVISHPCAGARWIVSTNNAKRDPRFKTKREAVAYALQLAKESHAYRRHIGSAM